MLTLHKPFNVYLQNKVYLNDNILVDLFIHIT